MQGWPWLRLRQRLGWREAAAAPGGACRAQRLAQQSRPGSGSGNQAACLGTRAACLGTRAQFCDKRLILQRKTRLHSKQVFIWVALEECPL